ncbi:MAG: hypothetical protein VW232_01585, partial [Alphaproteobacteria bacterium]
LLRSIWPATQRGALTGKPCRFAEARPGRKKEASQKKRDRNKIPYLFLSCVIAATKIFSGRIYPSQNFSR